MPRNVQVPIDAETVQDIVDVLSGLTGVIHNERVRAFNEGADIAYETAASLLEARLLQSDFPRDLETIRDGAAAIRALINE